MSLVYFFGCPEAGAVKIGSTLGKPYARLGQAQVNCPLELTLLGVCEGGADREAELHRQFSAHLIRGEWFALADPISAFIAQHTTRPNPTPRGWHGQARNRKAA